MPPAEVVSDNSAIGVMCNDVFGDGGADFELLTWPLEIELALSFSNLRMLRSPKIILSIGKLACFTFAFKILM